MPKSSPKKRKADAEEAAEDKGAAASPVKKAKGKAKTEKPKKEKVVKEPVTEREATPRQTAPAGFERGFKVVSWNVDGLRAAGRREDLAALVAEEAPDVVCLQETKLQEVHVDDWLDLLPGYDAAWSCSTVKNGYAGTAVFARSAPATPDGTVTVTGPGRFVRNGATVSGGGGGGAAAAAADGEGGGKKKGKKQAGLGAFFKPAAGAKPKAKAKAKGEAEAEAEAEGEAGAAPASAAAASAAAITYPHEALPLAGVQFGIGAEHDGEGRSITLLYEHFSVVALYVPNSGQKLERLDYRVDEWDPALRAYVKGLETTRDAPAFVLGDLNVAHEDVDCYNWWAPHLKKQPGCTARERESHSAWLASGYKDALRTIHGSACKGQYTYWSTRAVTARSENKGLRLDAFICSESTLPGAEEGHAVVRVVDSYVIPATTKTSDHAPIALHLGLCI